MRVCIGIVEHSRLYTHRAVVHKILLRISLVRIACTQIVCTQNCYTRIYHITDSSHKEKDSEE